MWDPAADGRLLLPFTPEALHLRALGKTALQMVAIAAELLVGSWAAWGLNADPEVLGTATNIAHGTLWIAALVTLWTGAAYWHKAHVAVGDN